MSAQFVSLAVGYALGGGVLRRKGVRQRPWLELQRLETEATYLNHQVRLLQQAAGSGLRSDLDVVAGRGFYDIRRARLQSPLLERALELLQPDGKPRLSDEVLQVAGLRGIASLWLDLGLWLPHGGGRLPLQTHADAESLAAHLGQQGVAAVAADKRGPVVDLRPAVMAELARRLRPHVHRSMRHALRPGSEHGLRLLRRGPLPAR
ncbi:MAG: hypothetical protein VKM98_08050 [Cyanobacteriota bacterium]|nr:hypothetical protein [Cyanobacteriota bacterium]